MAFPLNRQQLAHILRSACAVAHDDQPVVLGSQSILGTYDEDDLPMITTLSEEADIAFLDDADRSKADLVEGVLGELSGFHRTNSYYAEGIHLDTVTLPDGWRDRAVTWDLRSSEPARPVFLEPHDLAIAKLVAAREKDLAFVSALVRAGLLDPDVLTRRADLLPDWVSNEVRIRIHGWVDSVAASSRVDVLDASDRSGAAAASGAAPSEASASDLLTVEVEGQQFLVRPRGSNGLNFTYDYTWLTGPNPGYGYNGSGPSEMTHKEHAASIRSFLADIDPSTGYWREE